MLSVAARWWVLLAAIAVLVGAALAFAESGYLLGVGTVTANAQEQDGCQFAIGQHAFIVLHPSGEPCKIATSLLGKTGRLVFVPDE